MLGDGQNIEIESVGSDEKIPEAVGQLAIRMMKNNELIKDLLHELRQLYIRGQKDFRLSLAGRSDAEKKQHGRYKYRGSNEGITAEGTERRFFYG